MNPGCLVNTDVKRNMTLDIVLFPVEQRFTLIVNKLYLLITLALMVVHSIYIGQELRDSAAPLFMYMLKNQRRVTYVRTMHYA